MWTVELIRLALPELVVPQPILLQAFTLQLSGGALLLIFMVIGAYIGWLRGLRAILTVTLFSIIAYLITVRGGNEIVAFINRFYQNAPRLAAFAVGRDPDTVQVLDPLITPGFQVPLFFRFILFIAIIVFGWVYNKKTQWYSTARKEPLAPMLGLLAGAFTALLWVDGLATFSREAGNNLGGPIGTILSIIPDVGVFIPSLITIFFLILFLIIIFNLPKVWKAS